MTACTEPGSLFGLGINLGDNYDKVFDTLAKSTPKTDSMYEYCYSDERRRSDKEAIIQEGEYSNYNLCFYTKKFNLNDVEFHSIYPTFNSDLRLKKVQLINIHNYSEEGSAMQQRSSNDYDRIIEYLYSVYPESKRIRVHEREERKFANVISTIETFVTENDSVSIEHSVDYGGNDMSTAIISLEISLSKIKLST